MNGKVPRRTPPQNTKAHEEERRVLSFWIWTRPLEALQMAGLRPSQSLSVEHKRSFLFEHAAPGAAKQCNKRRAQGRPEEESLGCHLKHIKLQVSMLEACGIRALFNSILGK